MTTDRSASVADEFLELIYRRRAEIRQRLETNADYRDLLVVETLIKAWEDKGFVLGGAAPTLAARQEASSSGELLEEMLETTGLTVNQIIRKAILEFLGRRGPSHRKAIGRGLQAERLIRNDNPDPASYLGKYFTALHKAGLIQAAGKGVWALSTAEAPPSEG